MHSSHVLNPRTHRIGLEHVRCECEHCGAHVIARGAYTLAGSCGNCGSYELRPLRPSAPAKDAPAPIAA